MKVLKNTFAILDLLLASEGEKTLEELTQLSGINKTAISRIVSDLVAYGFLRQREKWGKYSLGFKYFDFTGQIKSRIKTRDMAVPFLVKLANELKESVILGMWDGGKAAITETFHSNHMVRVVPDEGSRLSLHSTGLGKVILANIGETQLERLYEHTTLERFTPNTITDLSDLRKHLIFIQREGVAFDDEENTLGVRGVSAVIKDVDGNVVGAIGVIGPTIRLTRDKIRDCVSPVRRCAQEISEALGFRDGAKGFSYSASVDVDLV
jgi:IclR family transcriptional regulator, KDG regulon repressor